MKLFFLTFISAFALALPVFAVGLDFEIRVPAPEGIGFCALLAGSVGAIDARSSEEIFSWRQSVDAKYQILRFLGSGAFYPWADEYDLGRSAFTWANLDNNKFIVSKKEFRAAGSNSGPNFLVWLTESSDGRLVVGLTFQALSDFALQRTHNQMRVFLGSAQYSFDARWIDNSKPGQNEVSLLLNLGNSSVADKLVLLKDEISEMVQRFNRLSAEARLRR